MNTAIASPTGYYSGYGFAVPIDLAKRVAQDLIEHGEVRRPKLGVAIDDVDPADAEVYRLDRPAGAEIKRVESGSAADRAGLRIGDVIVAVDGTAIGSSGDLMDLPARKDPSEKVTLDVVRYGERIRVRVDLDSFEPAVKAADRTKKVRESGLDRLGFSAAELTESLARRMRLEARDGVVIARVDESGPGRARRASPGDGHRALQRQGRGFAESAREGGHAVRPGEAVSLVVRLSDGTQTIINFRARG